MSRSFSTKFSGKDTLVSVTARNSDRLNMAMNG